ncbi:hypothetical protein [Sinorhizobium meliloti]|uniref:hypothetical protein n=1 Tax=Rhizobium meliloti TaxID=382 RepID=UPI001294EED1|nr:hypothetical protein [Sinorhizobium meliloti]MDW9491655.1 hypothetical protein [Sinorhizobium meliloti]MQV02921.1 hypothetical protein [Sinorhizobium meliloti]
MRFRKISLIPFCLMSVWLSCAEAQDGGVYRTPPKFLTEGEFISTKLKEQSKVIGKNATDYLQKRYPIVTFKLPYRGYVRGPGLRHKKKYTYYVDWSKAVIDISFNRKKKPLVSTNILSHKFIGEKAGPRPGEAYALIWNCNPHEVKQTVTDTDMKREESTRSREREEVRTREFEVKVTYDGQLTEASVKFASEVKYRFEEKITEVREARKTLSRGYEIIMPKFSNVQVGENTRGKISIYEVLGEATFDVPLYAHAAPWHRVSIGHWSDWVNSIGRTMPIQARVEVDERITDIDIARNLTTFPDQKSCDDARAAVELGKSVATTTKLNSLNLTFLSERIGDDTNTFVPAIESSLIDVSGSAKAECKAEVDGDGELSGDSLQTEFDIEIKDCPFQEYVSAGEIVFKPKVRYANGEDDTLNDYKVKWSDEAGESFSISDSQSLDENDVESIVELEDVEASWCMCYQED